MITIYEVRQHDSDQVYVGASVTPRQRFFKHLTLAFSGHGPNRDFYNWIRSYERDSFYYIELEQCETTQEAEAREDHWIEHYKNLGVCLNQTKSKYYDTEETRSRKSTNNIGKASGKSKKAPYRNEKAIAEAIQRLVNHNRSPEKKRQLTRALKGRKRPQHVIEVLKQNNMRMVEEGRCALQREDVKEKARQASVVSRQKHANRYVLTKDDGIEICVVRLGLWCEENGYNRPHLYAVMKGKRKKHKDIVQVELINIEEFYASK